MIYPAFLWWDNLALWFYEYSTMYYYIVAVMPVGSCDWVSTCTANISSCLPIDSRPPGQGWLAVVERGVLGHSINQTGSGPNSQPSNTITQKDIIMHARPNWPTIIAVTVQMVICSHTYKEWACKLLGLDPSSWRKDSYPAPKNITSRVKILNIGGL